MATLGPQLIKNSYQNLVQITASNALAKGDGTSISNISVTASWAQNASNAINAQTASFLPIGTYQITSSWAQSASNAVNAQNAVLSQTASFLPIGTYQITSSWAINSTNAQTAVSASYALTASVGNTINAVYAQTASIVLNQDFAIVYAIALG